MSPSLAGLQDLLLEKLLDELENEQIAMRTPRKVYPRRPLTQPHEQRVYVRAKDVPAKQRQVQVLVEETRFGPVELSVKVQPWLERRPLRRSIALKKGA